MKVRCHCSAPPSHPPMARAFGQCVKSLCGILAPKLGNALKICKPLPTRTNNATALIQWHKRTTSGCSFTARVTSPFFGSSISIARVAIVISPDFELQPVKLRIALVFPVADFLQRVRHLQVGQVLGLFVADLCRYV